MSHTIGGLDPWTQEALRELGFVLSRLRADAGLTQAALASRCGLSQPTISKLERGLAPGVRVAWLARLLVGLHRYAEPGQRPWEIRSAPAWQLLMRRFATNGTLATRLRHAEAERRARLESFIQLQASRRKETRTDARDDDRDDDRVFAGASLRPGRATPPRQSGRRGPP
ncbi:MAG TPA: helix-turn-helix transcriptional regulator [Candidatus Acidoferrales bacterium]|nr:helix-turn-helix transcriptional regulator [Candidatus Acidoferrales bacterium]